MIAPRSLSAYAGLAAEVVQVDVFPIDAVSQQHVDH